MHHVTTLRADGTTITDEEFDDYGKAAIRYCRIVLRHPQVHVQWIDGEALPGLPAKVVAQRFGNPDAPEYDPGSQAVNRALSEREERS